MARINIYEAIEALKEGKRISHPKIPYGSYIAIDPIGSCIYLRDTRKFPCEIERVFAHELFNLCIDEYREKYFKDGFVTCFTDLGLKEFIQASAKRVWGNSLSNYYMDWFINTEPDDESFGTQTEQKQEKMKEIQTVLQITTLMICSILAGITVVSLFFIPIMGLPWYYDQSMKHTFMGATFFISSIILFIATRKK